jgi:hypothetical protein
LKEHNSKLDEYDLEIILIDEFNIETLKKTSAIYLFDINDELIKKVTDFAIKNQILTFANNSNMLKKEIAISLFITKKVQPMINLKVLKDSNISLSHKIFKVSKVYEE